MGVTLLILTFVFVSGFGLVIYVYVDVENRKGNKVSFFRMRGHVPFSIQFVTEWYQKLHFH